MPEETGLWRDSRGAQDLEPLTVRVRGFHAAPLIGRRGHPKARYEEKACCSVNVLSELNCSCVIIWSGWRVDKGK